MSIPKSDKLLVPRSAASGLVPLEQGLFVVADDRALPALLLSAALPTSMGF